MMEIAALIAKATNQVNEGVEAFDSVRESHQLASEPRNPRRKTWANGQPGASQTSQA